MEAKAKEVPWLFRPAEGRLTPWGVVVWWERRRVAYNPIVLGTGFLSFVLCIIVIESRRLLPPGEDFEEPMVLFALPFLINICYTLGWVLELMRQSLPIIPMDQRFGPRLLRLGVTFSVTLMVLPLAGVLLSAFLLGPEAPR